MPKELLVQEFLYFFLAFIRITGMIMVMPIFGQAEVPPRVKGMIAIVISFALAPTLQPYFNIASLSYLPLGFQMGKEFIIGCFIGLTGRALLSILDIAGNIISYQLSLSNATLFNPTMGTQGAITSHLLLTIGATLILVLDLHHLFIQAIIHSYALFPVGKNLPLGDFSSSFVTTVSHMFAIGTQLTFPFILVGLILQFSLGLLNRLVPQIQVYFVALPLQIGLGLLVLALVISNLLLGFSEQFSIHFRSVFKIP